VTINAKKLQYLSKLFLEVLIPVLHIFEENIYITFETFSKLNFNLENLTVKVFVHAVAKIVRHL